MIYLNGNKHAQVISNSLQYFYPSYHQTKPVEVDSVVDQTSGSQNVEMSAADNSTTIDVSPSNPSSNTSNDSSEQSK